MPKLLKFPPEFRGKYGCVSTYISTGEKVLSEEVFNSRKAAEKAGRKYNKCKCGLSHDWKFEFAVPIYYRDGYIPNGG